MTFRRILHSAICGTPGGVALLATVMAGGALRPDAPFSFSELERTPKITPRQFGSLFADFRYEYSPYVQPVDEFLSNRRGDCDDYALLADHVLSHKGYHTRFVQVSLAGSDIAHAICYILENRAYLDYNNRRYEMNLERAPPTLRGIAQKVADAFEKNWTTATEYTFSYEDYRKHSRYTVVKTDPPDQDPDRRVATAP